MPGPIDFEGSNPGGSGGGSEPDPTTGSGDGSVEFGGNDDGTQGGGTPPTTYDYDVVSEASSVGGCYFASTNSSISGSGSVAIMSRLNAFVAEKTSSMDLNSCVSYAGNFGFSANKTSSMELNSCVSCIHKYNYSASLSSSVNAKYCVSVFPVDYSVYITGTSTFKPVEFESMTVFWASGDPAFSTVPVHFGSWGNSNMNNASGRLSERTAPPTSGLSGGIITTDALRFMWSEITPQLASVTNVGNIGNLASLVNASYRYVPFQHSVDYSNIVGNDTTSLAQGYVAAIPSLLAVIAYRDNYASVKPPSGFKKPEDGSGGLNNTGLTGDYSLAALLVSGA
jgi:hypothetical protein